MGDDNIEQGRGTFDAANNNDRGTKIPTNNKKARH